MQESLIVLCGVAGVAAAALIRRGRRTAGSALRSERNVLGRAVSLLERDPAYASERQELLPGYQARLKEMEQAIAGGRTPDPDTTIPREEQDAVADAPGHAVPDGDAGGAGEPGDDGAVPDSVTHIEPDAVHDAPEPSAGKGPGDDEVPAAVPDTRGEIAAVPDIPEPPDVGGGPVADEVRAAPDTHIEDNAISDIPEAPGGEPDTRTPPNTHSTPDTETEAEAGDAKMAEAAVSVDPHADTISQPGDASAAGGAENKSGHDAPGKGPDSTVERPPDTPAAAPPKTSGGDTPMQGRAGTATSGNASPAVASKDIHEDASGRPGEGPVAGDGPASDPDGDDSEDLEKIKADIIKTLNRLQRAEDD